MWQRIRPLFAIFLFSYSAVAQDIYKWTDEQGNVHFGSKPPNLEQRELVEELGSKPVLESDNKRQIERKATAKDFSGHYVGARLGQTVHWVFSPKGYFVESLVYEREGYSAKNMRSYAGTWSFNKNYLKFTPTFTDHGSNFIAPPTTAAILGVKNRKLRVIIDDVEVTFVPRYSGGRVAFPKHMR